MAWVAKHLMQVSTMFGQPVIWSCGIRRLHLCRGVRPPLNECRGYDTKQSDGEAALLEVSGTWSTPSSLLRSSPL